MVCRNHSTQHDGLFYKENIVINLVLFL